MTEDEVRAFINSHKWTFAKTYARFAPHEYLVKEHLPDEDKIQFERLAVFIRLCGFTAYFGRDIPDHYKQYFEFDGYYYWIMNEPAETANIINRGKVEDYPMQGQKMYYRGLKRCR